MNATWSPFVEQPVDHNPFRSPHEFAELAPLSTSQSGPHGPHGAQSQHRVAPPAMQSTVPMFSGTAPIFHGGSHGTHGAAHSAMLSPTLEGPHGAAQSPGWGPFVTHAAVRAAPTISPFAVAAVSETPQIMLNDAWLPAKRRVERPKGDNLIDFGDEAHANAAFEDVELAPRQAEAPRAPSPPSAAAERISPSEYFASDTSAHKDSDAKRLMEALAVEWKPRPREHFPNNEAYRKYRTSFDKVFKQCISLRKDLYQHMGKFQTL